MLKLSTYLHFRCPVYQNVPDVCTMVPDQNDPTCCQMPKCNFTPVNNTINGQGGGVSTLAPGTYQGSGTGVNIGMIKVLVLGIYIHFIQYSFLSVLLLIYYIFSPGFCLYKGKQYTQGQTWDDGCEFRCECKDMSTGRYVCSDMLVSTFLIPKHLNHDEKLFNINYLQIFQWK